MPQPPLKRRLKELATLNRILETLNRKAEFAQALQAALEELVELLNLSTGWVFLTQVEPGDARQGGLSLAATTGLPPALNKNGQACLRSGGCDCHWLFRHGRLDTGVNIVTCSRLENARGNKGGLEVHASVPLLEDGPVGILNLASPGSEPFDGETLEFLTAVGRTLGLAFRRTRLQAQQVREREALAALEERARLAREMHDSVAQLLFAADLSLRVARESPKQRDGALERSSELVGTALSELRGLVELLRPADLSQGLRPALERLAERVSGSVQVHLDVADVDVSEAWAETLYRAAQEGLHNALRHAQASTIWIRLNRQRSALRLQIEDDGRGLPAKVIRGLGLMSLEQRMEAAGGKLRLRSRMKGGAVLEVMLGEKDTGLKGEKVKR